MVQINFASREVNCKIVYYGPGRSGKTTNLEIVHAKAPKDSIGELISIATETDRTLYFDFLPLDLGTVAGMTTKFQLYTVPGQVFYNATRKLVLQGSDGVVFVADSHPDMRDENIESLENLVQNLKENGIDINEIPLVFQWNKRDLPTVASEEELNAQLNKYGAPTVNAVAVRGDGVFPTLKTLSSLVIKKLNQESGGGSRQAPKPAAPPKPVQTARPTRLPPRPAATPRPTQPAAPRPAQPAAPRPAAPAPRQAQPAAPRQAQPAAPRPAQPAAPRPAAAQPAQPAAAKPAQPAAAKPAQPAAAKPAQPVAAKPAQPVAAKPAQPVAAKPAQPVAAKPAPPPQAPAQQPVVRREKEPVDDQEDSDLMRARASNPVSDEIARRKEQMAKRPKSKKKSVRERPKGPRHIRGAQKKPSKFGWVLGIVLLIMILIVAALCVMANVKGLKPDFMPDSILKFFTF